jgi:hypothetical protein
MYKLLRDLHLIIGLFSAVFLIGYGLSAAQMAYPIYRPQPRVSVQEISVPEGVPTAPRPLARWLMDEHDLRGDLTEVSTTSISVSLTIVRPGTTHQVEYARGAARVTTRTLNAVGMLNRIHHIGGVSHEYWAINAWGWFLLVLSIGLLVLAITGVVMWFQRHRERKIGAVLLVCGLGWGITLLILVRSA